MSAMSAGYETNWTPQHREPSEPGYCSTPDLNPSPSETDSTPAPSACSGPRRTDPKVVPLPYRLAPIIHGWRFGG